MRSPKYPLSSLALLREKEVDQAANEFAGRVTASEVAERAREAAERKRDLHEEATARARAAEDEALACGVLRAADLARADALSTEVARELTNEQQARKNELESQAQLASRQAAAQVVAKDRARWSEGQRKKAEARDEEASSEAWRPKP